MEEPSPNPATARAVYVEKREPLPPHKKAEHDDEVRLLGPSDGVFDLEAGPAMATATVLLEDRVDPLPHGSPDEGRHLWVIAKAGAPALLEEAPNVKPPLQLKKAKHTNLTGGAEAYCGGEVWFDPDDDTTIYVNGASGRYGPQKREDLEDAVSFFRHLGFNVVSFGWDEDNDWAVRVYRG